MILPMKNKSFTIVLAGVLLPFGPLYAAASAATVQHKQPEALPAVADFQPERYLGKWYEVARLPSPFQPAGTLSVAEYGAAEQPGELLVKNSLFDKQGKKLADIAGRAKLAEGAPAGRLLVSFGEQWPSQPNYHVIYLDSRYRFAVVGVPQRSSLWILAREVPIAKETLQSLLEVAKKAGFDLKELQVADWSKTPQAETKPQAPQAQPAKP